MRLIILRSPKSLHFSGLGDLKMYLGYSIGMFFLLRSEGISSPLSEAWVQQPPRMPETWRQKALMEQHVDLTPFLGMV